MCMSLPGQIVEIVDPDHRLAKVEFEGSRRLVNLGMLTPEEGKIGDWVIVQAGLAIGLLSAEEAQETLRLLRELEQMYEDKLS